MAKKKITYVCEKCGVECESEKEAIECESEHLIPCEVEALHYSLSEEYPDTMQVKFSNGTKKTYTASSIN